MTETVECPYCGEVFEGEDEADARTKEGVHRAEEHVNQSDTTSKATKGRNIIDKWKTDGRKA
jgi:sarcosine oxidase delta subunit